MSFLTVPRCITTQDYHQVYLHGFAEASKVAVCASIYTVCLSKNGGVTQNLLVTKSRIDPKDLTIPRLKLTVAHTLAKLVAHARLSLTENTFKEINLKAESMATLYWLLNRRTWSQYVRNQVKAIKRPW